MTTAYQPPHFGDRLSAMLDATFAAGDVPTVRDLAPFDQFHTGGYAATVQLGELLQPGAGDRVLDIGAGLGGPARYLAATYGCRVSGIDASDTFVAAATTLSERARLADRVEIAVGDAAALPFDAARFDAAILLHVAMNVADRATLYGEVRRVLRAGGRFLTYDVIRRDGEPAYPLPWALDPATSHLRSEAETKAALEAAGFAVQAWRTEGPSAAASLLPPPGAQPPPMAALLGADFPLRVRNLAAALRDGHVAILTALLARS